MTGTDEEFAAIGKMVMKAVESGAYTRVTAGPSKAVEVTAAFHSETGMRFCVMRSFIPSIIASERGDFTLGAWDAELQKAKRARQMEDT